MAALSIVRATIRAADPDLALVRPSGLADVVNESIAGARFLMGLLATFAGVAMTIAVVGIYSVVAYVTGQRRTEIGLRLALGAEPRDVVRLVVLQGMTPIATGLLVGAVVTCAAVVALGAVARKVRREIEEGLRTAW